MLAAIDIHKAVFQAAVLDPVEGEITEERFKASREALVGWLAKWEGKLEAVALEATTGWRWVARELQARGIAVALTDAGQASALQGQRKRAKTDRLDARWLVTLLGREMLPEAWLAPEEIQRLRDKTRLRKALADDHTRWAQRLHAILVHEGWACSRGSLLTASGRRWVAAIRLHPGARAQVQAMLTVMTSLAEQLDLIDCELRAMAKTDERLKALGRIFGIGPILAATILAEIGDAKRFRRSRQVVRVAGLDPVVRDSADTQRRGHLAKQGAPCLRWALVEAAQHACRTNSPDHELYVRARGHAGANPATLTVARKIAKRAFHTLRELETQPA
ncbi:MAG: IS110 family transposase [Actinomycetota bacterium]|nr:IS110 family transposase [Actinomycetota bacterium]